MPNRDSNPSPIRSSETKAKAAKVEEELRYLYERAPPVGVTLVLTASCSDAALFADAHPLLFREKTLCVIHMGGAQLVSATADLQMRGTQLDEEDAKITGDTMLVPDPAAQNNRLDMPAATRFYRTAQALSVPLLILSRHFAQACRLPRALFDALTDHCGVLGKILGSEQREAMEILWARACAPADDTQTRAGLPPRCNAKWFSSTFCDGAEISHVDAVWDAVESLKVYNPICLIAALHPEFVNAHMQATKVELYSALV